MVVMVHLILDPLCPSEPKDTSGLCIAETNAVNN